jgi:hypothetical protein
MSRLTLQEGLAAPERDTLVLHARQSVALARTGLTLGEGDLSPAQQALLHAMEARGLALASDPHAARTAVTAAETAYAKTQPGDEPHWLAFYTPAELEADLGRTLTDLGDYGCAARALTTARDTYEPWRARSRCFVDTDLATVHLRAGDHERAAATTRSAAAAAGPISSTRTTQRLKTLHRAVSRQAHRSQALRLLDDELTHLLARPDLDPRI